MFDVFYVIYFGLLVLGAGLSLIVLKKGDKKTGYLFILLVLTILIEWWNLELSIHKISGFLFRYHIFILFEYTMFCLYYIAASNNATAKLLVKISIGLFIASALFSSIFITHFQGFPTRFINVEGFLLIIIYTHLLFNIDIDLEKNLYELPAFWLSVGILFFYGAIFVFFVLYPFISPLFSIDTKIQYSFILRPTNLIFYICIIINLACSLRNKTFSSL